MNIEGLINLSTYFIIYSMLGWVLESVFKSILFKKLVNSGFLHGPFCPIYGAGALIMILFLGRFSDNILMLFVMSFVVLTLWEYLVGILLEKLFHTKYWDYSNNRFNFQGRICLQNSIYWGILGVLFIKLIHPFMIEQVKQIPTQALINFNILILVLLLTDSVISIVKLNTYENKLKQLKEIGENIKEKLKNFKYESSQGKLSKEALQKKMDELNQKPARMKRSMYRQIIRLRKAFPTMKSEKITQILKTINIKEKERKKESKRKNSDSINKEK